MKNIIYVIIIALALCMLGFFVIAESANESPDTGAKSGIYVNDTSDYSLTHWEKIKKMKDTREIINLINSEGEVKDFMKKHDVSVILNYDNITNIWSVTFIPKKNTERLLISIDNDTKKIIHTKILRNPKSAISKKELDAIVDNMPRIKEFTRECKKNRDCERIKIKKWYDKEKGVWVVTVYGNCKNCKRIIFIDGETGSIIENKSAVDKATILDLVKSSERIKSFMKNHPNAKVNAVYDEISNQWHATISYQEKPGKVKEITIIVDGETREIVSADDWEYSRDKFK